MKIKVGITGQSGFVGTHLYNLLSIQEDIELIEFEKDLFEKPSLFEEFVKKCDTIIHLAAVNRHHNQDELFDINVSLTEKLIEACEASNSTPYIIFSSSTQEEKNNIYGKAKYECRKRLNDWAIKNKAKFSGLIIPNVFGPFGNPFYNSFIATFCHQLTHNETPEIHVDGEVNLIYVGELSAQILDRVKKGNDTESSFCVEELIKHTSTHKVSEILNLLKQYKELYFENGIMPSLNSIFERNLFNTFLCYIDHNSFFPFFLKQHSDNRGSFVEVIKLNSGGQVSFSTTVSGITRGNHFHTRKAERFCVIKGKAKIEFRRIGTDKISSFILDGDKPSFVDMPIWHTHNITNIGEEELYTIFWINEHYDPNDGDTYFQDVNLI